MDNERSFSDEVKSLSSLFNTNNEMNEVHQQLTEVARRLDRLESRMPSSFIPQYRIRNDPEYKPLGKVLDQVFEQIDDLHDQLEEIQNQNLHKIIKDFKKNVDDNAN